MSPFKVVVPLLLILHLSLTAPLNETSSAKYRLHNDNDDENIDDKIPSFVKWPPDLRYPDCARLFRRSSPDDDDYLADAIAARLTHSDERARLNEPFTCADYRARGHYVGYPLSDEEAAFPIAFANIIYSDFDLLERIFSVMYAPQNFYCYIVDEKASPAFKRRVVDWAACFSNVIIPPARLFVHGSGHNTSIAHMTCMRALDAYDWKYIILLQNHDLPLRSNAELVRILSVFDGANDVSTLKVTPSSLNESANWTFAHLKLFHNESRNVARLAGGLGDARLHMTKSLVSVSLSRASVDFILHQLNVTGFVRQLEEVAYGMDENFMSTLNSNDFVGVPGGFTRACLLRGQPVAAITRYATWNNHPGGCRSGNFRHTVCVFGVEDLYYLTRRHELFLNKMMPSFDYGASMCWLESIYNRTHFSRGGFYANDADESRKNNTSEADDNNSAFNVVYPLHEQYYATLPQVRFHRERLAAAELDAVLPRDNIFVQLLNDQRRPIAPPAKEEFGWQLMREIYEMADDDLTDENDPLVQRLDASTLKSGAQWRDFFSTSMAATSHRADIFDYFNFNCAHPHRDYHF